MRSKDNTLELYVAVVFGILVSLFIEVLTN